MFVMVASEVVCELVIQISFEITKFTTMGRRLYTNVEKQNNIHVCRLPVNWAHFSQQTAFFVKSFVIWLKFLLFFLPSKTKTPTNRSF